VRWTLAHRMISKTSLRHGSLQIACRRCRGNCAAREQARRARRKTETRAAGRTAGRMAGAIRRGGNFPFAMCRLLCSLRDKVPRAARERGRFGTHGKGGRLISVLPPRRPPNFGSHRIVRMCTGHSLTNGAVLRFSVTHVAHFVMRRSIFTPHARCNPLF
jgi:hypothetical protein